MSNRTTLTADDVAGFTDYVLRWYEIGNPDALDELATRDEIVAAIDQHLAARPFPFEGDSCDREAVRAIIEANAASKAGKAHRLTWLRGCSTYWTGDALRYAEGAAGTYAVTATDYDDGSAALWVYSPRLGQWSGASCQWYASLAAAMSAARALDARGADAVDASVRGWVVAR
jgi:hypothetical protein